MLHIVERKTNGLTTTITILITAAADRIGIRRCKTALPRDRLSIPAKTNRTNTCFLLLHTFFSFVFAIRQRTSSGVDDVVLT